MTSEIHGAIPTILKYGDVFIQTASTKQRFQFHQVPDPDGIRDMIIKLVQRNRKEQAKEMKLDHI